MRKKVVGGSPARTMTIFGYALPDAYALVRRQIELRGLADVERRVPLIHVSYRAIGAVLRHADKPESAQARLMRTVMV